MGFDKDFDYLASACEDIPGSKEFSPRSCIKALREFMKRNRIYNTERKLTGYGEMLSENASKFYIGISDVDFRKVSDFDMPGFVRAVVSAHHEKAHASQLYFGAREDSEIARYLTLNYYACRCSAAYYNGWIGNYRKQPYELSAQYVAYEKAYSFLSDFFGDERLAEKLVCAHVNDRIAHSCEFVGFEPEFGGLADPLKTMDELRTAFESQFEALKSVHKTVPINNDKKLRSAIDGSPYRDELLARLRTTEQDLCLSYVYFRIYGHEQDVLSLDCLASVDLADAEKPVAAMPPRQGNGAVFADLRRVSGDISGEDVEFVASADDIGFE